MKKVKRPLEGLKVVDFSWVFTGPMVTKYLGDHGAEIIKIESAARPSGRCPGDSGSPCSRS